MNFNCSTKGFVISDRVRLYLKWVESGNTVVLIIGQSVRILRAWHQYTSSKLREYRGRRLAYDHYRKMLLRSALQRWGEYLVHRHNNKVWYLVLCWFMKYCCVEKDSRGGALQ